jgi:hypothetical protein
MSCLTSFVPPALPDAHARARLAAPRAHRAAAGSAPLRDLRPCVRPQCAYGDAKGTEGEEWKDPRRIVYEHSLLKREARPAAS